MSKIAKKKTVLYFYILIIFTYLLILVANYFLGTNDIIDAHQNQFRGGMCGACQSCFEPICNSKSGFDINYLYFSLLFFTLIVGFINVIFDKSLSFSLLIVIASALGYFIVTEMIIKTFNIAVLYTSFTEGRQSLLPSAFSTVNIEFNIPPLFFSIITSLVGNIIGFPFLLAKKKFVKKF